MIEFKGYISGKAEKHFFKVPIIYTVVLITLYLVVGLLALLFSPVSDSIVLKACLILPLFLVADVLVVQNKKKRRSYLTNTVFVENGCMVCKSDKETTQRLISDARALYDYGAYYKIAFPFLKSSFKFICQKDLLTQGTLEDFEKLFEGKIVRKCQQT